MLYSTCVLPPLYYQCVEAVVVAVDGEEATVRLVDLIIVLVKATAVNMRFSV